jgi:hypothetical protein
LRLYDSVGHTGHNFPLLDGYMLLAAPFDAELRSIDGVDWWFYESRYPAITPSPRQLAYAAQEHHKLASDGQIILGAIARAMKLTDEFLDAVASILKARPNTRFVWTDFLPDQTVQNKLAERGILDRCHYAGYVDHVAWAEILDIHLDPFPFASGITMRQTWHAGRPYVMMASRYHDSCDNTQTNSLGIAELSLDPIFALPEHHPVRQSAEPLFGLDRQHLAMAHSYQDYIDWALRLIDSPSLRSNVGMAAKAYSDNILTDLKNVAHSHLAGIHHFLNKKISNTSSANNYS